MRHLKDSTFQYWTQADITAYINEAIQRVAVDGGPFRYVLTFALTAGQHTYALTAPGVPATPAGTVGFQETIGLYGISLIMGARRIPLKNPSYRQLMAFINQYTLAEGPPQSWARLGANQIVFGSIPDQAYTTEWDCKVIPNKLVATGDTDPTPYPFSEAVPYYAAYLAKIQQQQYQEAARFYNPDPANMGLYQQRLLEAIASIPDVVPDILGTDGEMPWGWAR